PEFAASGWAVPPGISDATVPNPIFSLTAVATVDEGNNWVNLRWGPLSLVNPATNNTLGNYSLSSNSPAIDYIPVNATTFPTATVPTLTRDFFGNARPDTSRAGVFDVGAVEYQGTDTTAVLILSGGPLAFGNQIVTTTSAAQTLTLTNNGGLGATGITVAVTAPFAKSGGTCGATLAAGASCTINVTFTPTTAVSYTGMATVTANVTVNGSPAALSGFGMA